MHFTISNRPSILQMGDTLSFEVAPHYLGEDFMLYKVNDNFLVHCDAPNNDTIFGALGLNKYEVCDSFYGYSNQGGSWPSFKDNDYNGVTNLVNYLYDLLEGKNPKDIQAINDSGAKIPHTNTVEVGLKTTLQLVNLAEHRITSSEITQYLEKNYIQGFGADDVDDTLGELFDLGILTYAEEAGKTVFFVNPDKKAHLAYLAATKNAQSVTLKTIEKPAVGQILSDIRNSSGSVLFTTLSESVIGRELGDIALRKILDDLVSRSLLKSWEKGYYTHPANQSEVSAIIAECQTIF